MVWELVLGFRDSLSKDRVSFQSFCVVSFLSFFCVVSVFFGGG